MQSRRPSVDSSVHTFRSAASRVESAVSVSSRAPGDTLKGSDRPYGGHASSSGIDLITNDVGSVSSDSSAPPTPKQLICVCEIFPRLSVGIPSSLSGSAFSLRGRSAIDAEHWLGDMESRGYRCMVWETGTDEAAFSLHSVCMESFRNQFAIFHSSSRFSVPHLAEAVSAFTFWHSLDRHSNVVIFDLSSFNPLCLASCQLAVDPTLSIDEVCERIALLVEGVSFTVSDKRYLGYMRKLVKAETTPGSLAHRPRPVMLKQLLIDSCFCSDRDIEIIVQDQLVQSSVFTVQFYDAETHSLVVHFPLSVSKLFQNDVAVTVRSKRSPLSLTYRFNSGFVDNLTSSVIHCPLSEWEVFSKEAIFPQSFSVQIITGPATNTSSSPIVVAPFSLNARRSKLLFSERHAVAANPRLIEQLALPGYEKLDSGIALKVAQNDVADATSFLHRFFVTISDENKLGHKSVSGPLRALRGDSPLVSSTPTNEMADDKTSLRSYISRYTQRSFDRASLEAKSIGRHTPMFSVTGSPIGHSVVPPLPPVRPDVGHRGIVMQEGLDQPRHNFADVMREVEEVDEPDPAQNRHNFADVMREVEEVDDVQTRPVTPDSLPERVSPVAIADRVTMEVAGRQSDEEEEMEDAMERDDEDEESMASAFDEREWGDQIVSLLDQFGFQDVSPPTSPNNPELLISELRQKLVPVSATPSPPRLVVDDTDDFFRSAAVTREVMTGKATAPQLPMGIAALALPFVHEDSVLSAEEFPEGETTAPTLPVSPSVVGKTTAPALPGSPMPIGKTSAPSLPGSTPGLSGSPPGKTTAPGLPSSPPGKTSAPALPGSPPPLGKAVAPPLPGSPPGKTAAPALPGSPPSVSKAGAPPLPGSPPGGKTTAPGLPGSPPGKTTAPGLPGSPAGKTTAPGLPGSPPGGTDSSPPGKAMAPPLPGFSPPSGKVSAPSPPFPVPSPPGKAMAPGLPSLSPPAVAPGLPSLSPPGVKAPPMLPLRKAPPPTSTAVTALDSEQAPDQLPLGRKLHWKPIRNVEQTIWATFDSDSMMTDFSHMKQVFDTDADRPSLARSVSGFKPDFAKSSAPAGPPVLTLLESKRAQNIGVVVARIPIELVTQKLASLDAQALSVENLDRLKMVLPTEEEAGVFAQFKGDIKLLRDIEQKVIGLFQLPRLSQRIKFCLVSLQLPTIVSDLQTEISVIRACVAEIKGSMRLKKVLQLVLLLGNYLNQGQKTKGFSVESLAKLTEFKSASDPAITTMHFLVARLMQADAACIDLYAEIPTLKQIAKITPESIGVAVNVAKHDPESIKNEVAHHADAYTAAAVQRMDSFVAAMEPKVSALAVQWTTCDKELVEVRRFFGEDPKKLSAEEFFGHFRTFFDALASTAADLKKRPKKFEKILQARSPKITPTSVTSPKGGRMRVVSPKSTGL